MARIMSGLRWIAAHARILFWSLFAILSAVLFGWYAFFRRRDSESYVSKKTVGEIVEPSFQESAHNKIVIAETEARIEAEIAQSKSEEQRAKLEEIKKVEDPSERRRALASWLDNNL